MNPKQKEIYENSRNITLQLVNKGKSIPEIASKRKFAFSTIEKHLEKLLEDKKISLTQLLSEEKIELIKKVILESDEMRLKPIKEKLPENIVKQMKDVPIGFSEFKQMIDQDEIKICKLPPEKRKQTISWWQFERIYKENKDFWQDSS